ncbi:MAG: hypothetical protein ACOCRX_09160 [Candidatus Woesearchaeota archaeon]
MDILEKIDKYLDEAKKAPKKGSADYHQYKIAVDTVKNPSKALMGGPSEEEAIKTLKKKFGYTDKDIKKLQK